MFDIRQTDGQPLPEIGSVNGDPREYRERLAIFAAERGIALEYSDEIAPVRGTSSGGKITLLPGQSPAEEFATLAHEIAHEMMHRHDRRCSTTKRIRETEAEAVAFVVCSAIGLETGSAAQDYICLYGGDANLLTESLELRPADCNPNSQRYRRGCWICTACLARVIQLKDDIEYREEWAEKVGLGFELGPKVGTNGTKSAEVGAQQSVA